MSRMRYAGLVLCALAGCAGADVNYDAGFAGATGGRDGFHSLGDGGAAGGAAGDGSGGQAPADAGTGGVVATDAAAGAGGTLSTGGAEPPPPDQDGDGYPDATDACPFDPDNDADRDGVCGDVDPDRCPAGDRDLDGNGWADACDVVLAELGPEQASRNSAEEYAIGLVFEPAGTGLFIYARPAPFNSADEVVRVAELSIADQSALAGSTGFFDLRAYGPPNPDTAASFGGLGSDGNYDFTGAHPIRVFSIGSGADGQVTARVEVRGYRTP